MFTALNHRALAAHVAVTGYIVGAFNRLERDDRGQGSVEYVGIIIVVGLIIAAIITFATPIGTTIGTKIQSAVNGIG